MHDTYAVRSSMRRIVAAMRGTHARDSGEWRRRIEGPPEYGPGRRS